MTQPSQTQTPKPRRVGGSYIKDKRTGALTPNPAERKAPPAPAAEAPATTDQE